MPEQTHPRPEAGSSEPGVRRWGVGRPQDWLSILEGREQGKVREVKRGQVPCARVTRAGGRLRVL